MTSWGCPGPESCQAFVTPRQPMYLPLFEQLGVKEAIDRIGMAGANVVVLRDAR
jgi:hypothetical protein